MICKIDAKVTEKTETSKFSVEKGTLTFEGKCYCQCDPAEKRRFNDALTELDRQLDQERENRVFAMLQRATLPLVYQYLPTLQQGQMYKTEPHFV